MNEIERTVKELILEVLTRDAAPAKDVAPIHHLVRDLGLRSMQLAEIVARLEMELDYNPFSKDLTIADIHTVADLCKAYGAKV